MFTTTGNLWSDLYGKGPCKRRPHDEHEAMELEEMSSYDEVK